MITEPIALIWDSQAVTNAVVKANQTTPRLPSWFQAEYPITKNDFQHAIIEHLLDCATVLSTEQEAAVHLAMTDDHYDANRLPHGDGDFLIFLYSEGDLAKIKTRP